MPDEPPLLREPPEDPPLFEPDEPPLRELPDAPLLFAPPPPFEPPPDDPPRAPADEPPPFAPPPPLFEPPDDPPLFAAPPLLLRDEAELPPLREAVLLFDAPPLLEREPPVELFAPPDDDEPPLRLPPPRPDDDEPPLLERELVERALLPPLERDEEPELLFFPPLAARAAAAPTAAPAAAPAAVASGFLRREVLRFSFSPRPALKPTVVRSGILISVPVRGLRPLRAARVRRVNFPNPGMDSDPAACTASEMAPDAVSKIASTTRAAAVLVSSAFSATASMNSDLFMFRSPDRRFTRRGPSAPETPHANSVPHRFASSDLESARVVAAMDG